jgi:signal recognition particle subunit SRP19
MAEVMKWPVLYPVYLDKRLTRAQGRRVPLEAAVELPNVAEMVECVKKLGVIYMLEDKSHPKSPFMRARIRVRLFEADQKTPVKPEIAKSKLELMKKLCDMIPTCDARVLVEKKAGERQKEGDKKLKNMKQNMAKQGNTLDVDFREKGMRNPGKHKLKKNEKKKNAK